jgi:ribosomal protein L37AE/L43A
MRTSDSKKSVRTKLQCPNCKEEQLARIGRRGFFRERVFPKFGYYPWECAICRNEFLIRKRGGAYRKASSSTATIKPSPEGNTPR